LEWLLRIPCGITVPTETHLFNGLFSRTTCVSQHQEGYTNLDFNKARGDGVAVASAGPVSQKGANNSQGSAETRFRHGGIFYDNFTKSYCQV